MYHVLHIAHRALTKSDQHAEVAQAIGVTGDQTHRYTMSGDHTVTISGGFERISLSSRANASKLMSIDQLGAIEWTSMDSAFYRASNMEHRATDSPDLSGVTDMSYMFSDTRRFNGDISGWNVSSVTNMSYMFNIASAFNRDISGWDVSGVTDMSFMFSGIFNQPLNSWNVSSVTTMTRMFSNNYVFNQDLNNWNVSPVTDMYSMFRGADAFNGDISSWNVSSVTTMTWMFYDARSFNDNISSWNVSSVTTMSSMFRQADAFNGDISGWNVSNVRSMHRMFNSADIFNQDLNGWNTSSVTDMRSMFAGTEAFNDNISSWDVSSVTDMDQMFTGANSFEQNLGKWYVVLDDTAISGATDTLAIMAQNPILDGQNLAYSLGEDGDSELFVVSGRTLGLNSTVDYSDKTAYSVNITSTGAFGTGNNRMTDITVTDANRNPALATITPKTATEHVELSFTVTATDADGNPVTFSLDGTLLNGTAITPGGVFTWTPAEDQDGVHTVTVLVTDSRGGTHERDVTITVNEVNEAPELHAIDPKTAN